MCCDQCRCFSRYASKDMHAAHSFAGRVWPATPGSVQYCLLQAPGLIIWYHYKVPILQCWLFFRMCTPLHSTAGQGSSRHFWLPMVGCHVWLEGKHVFTCQHWLANTGQVWLEIFWEFPDPTHPNYETGRFSHNGVFSIKLKHTIN